MCIPVSPCQMESQAQRGLNYVFHILNCFKPSHSQYKKSFLSFASQFFQASLTISELTLVFGSLPNSQAEVFKEQGNVFYSQKAYSDAFNCYTKAIGKQDCFT